MEKRNQEYKKVVQKEFFRYKDEILQEIEKYNLHLSNLTLMTIFSMLGGKRFNILNLGQTGIGKSRSTLELSRLLNLNDIIEISGHITALKFFELLEKYPTSLFVIDEGSNILINNSEIIHLLRSALYDSHVVWYSSFKDESGTQIVRSVFFTGSIIFNCNHFKAFNMNDKALLDRLYVSNTRLTTIEVINKINDSYEPNKEIWGIVRDRIIQIRNKQINSVLTDEEKGKIKEYVIGKIKEITLSYNSNISVRLLEKITEVFHRFKLFFGEIDWDYCRKISDNYFLDVHAEENFILKAISSNNGKIKIKELAQIISDFENVSIRTSYRRINEFCDLNQDKLIIRRREVILK